MHDRGGPSLLEALRRPWEADPLRARRASWRRVELNKAEVKRSYVGQEDQREPLCSQDHLVFFFFWEGRGCFGFKKNFSREKKKT